MAMLGSVPNKQGQRGSPYTWQHCSTVSTEEHPLNPGWRRVSLRHLTLLRCLYEYSRKNGLSTAQWRRLLVTEWSSECKEYGSLPWWREPLSGVSSRTPVLLPHLWIWGDTGCLNRIQRAFLREGGPGALVAMTNPWAWIWANSNITQSLQSSPCTEINGEMYSKK